MSEEETTQSGLAELSNQLLKDPDTQKALLDMAKPVIQMQETIFQTVIDQQNAITQALQVVIDKLVEIDGKLVVLTEKGGN